MTTRKKTINTLKLLITDGCNLSCIYCVPELQTKKLRKKGLKHGELLRLVRALISLGVENIDLRGGEPLNKKWLLPFLEEILRTPEVKRVSLSTNGVVLKDYAGELRNLGLTEVGVHMDSLSFEKYMKITRGDHLYRVYAGLRAAEEAGFERIKVYTVILKGLNSKEIIEFALLTKDHAYEVVFLEYDPYDAAETQASRSTLRYPAKKIWDDIDNFQKLYPVTTPLAGEGAFYRFEDGFKSGDVEKGVIRFVSPTKTHRCDRCSRITLTTDGLLSACFLTDKTVDLRPLLELKEGHETAAVGEAVKKALRNRPRRVPRQEKPFRLCAQFCFLDE